MIRFILKLTFNITKESGICTNDFTVYDTMADQMK